jgi:hypothetical protein
MSRRQRREGPPPGPELGVFVNDRDDFVNKHCKAAVASALGRTSLGFSSTEATGRHTVYSLGGPGERQADGKKYSYKVLPFKEWKGKYFWLAVTLEFDSLVGVHQLESASIFVFEGEPSDSVKNAIMRAEWACLPSDIGAAHAQPHWHVYPSQLSRTVEQSKVEPFSPEAEIRTFGDDEVTTEAENAPYIGQAGQDPELSGFGGSGFTASAESEWANSEDFHFAMSSRWHDGRDDNDPLLAEQVPKWLKGCLTYIRVQFDYIYKPKSRPL